MDWLKTKLYIFEPSVSYWTEMIVVEATDYESACKIAEEYLYYGDESIIECGYTTYEIKNENSFIAKDWYIE